MASGVQPSPNLTDELSQVPVSGSDDCDRAFEILRSGAAWRLRLLRNGIEVGGMVCGDADYQTALEEGENWITVPPEGWPV